MPWALGVQALGMHIYQQGHAAVLPSHSCFRLVRELYIYVCICMAQVLCHDCGKMGFAPFHFVYHCCPHCRSYNTRVS